MSSGVGETVIKICPRCGEPYTSIKCRSVYGREYVYAVHGSGKNRRECYLGPAEEYQYVERLHSLGVLTNIREQDYVELAVRALERAKAVLASTKTARGARRKVDPGYSLNVEKLRKLAEEVIRIIGELEGYEAEE